MNRRVAVFDLDGTLADLTHRLYLIESAPKKWDCFFAACDQDKPILAAVAWARYMSKDHTLVILSGRSDECREKTEAWLEKYEVPYHYLFMRKAGDHREDVILKSQMMDELVLQLGEVELVVDDRPSVLEMWRARGFETYAVTGEEWATWPNRR